MLRQSIPVFLEEEPAWDIYTDGLETRDPAGVALRGLASYQVRAGSACGGGAVRARRGRVSRPLVGGAHSPSESFLGRSNLKGPRAACEASESSLSVRRRAIAARARASRTGSPRTDGED